ncbi:MAG: restriction endonuclease subunit S [Methanomethylovorans sp.]|nr:restriction endonuclease subunit S [Methanomethylovorans sp.]
MAGEVRLAEVAEIIMGQSPPGETYNEIGEGLPFFQGVADFNYRFPTPRVYCTAPSRIAQPSDILLSVRAPIGRVNIADRECAIGRGLCIIRACDPANARYLEFALRAKESQWDAIEGSGSVFGNATRRDLEMLLIPWPEEKAERLAIAHILGTLDDKIELNRRMSETLEQMARALFKAWFVDFEPVRAKMEGRWQRGESLPGLPAHLYDLFPDRLVDSELGQIPEGWGVVSLPDMVEINPTRPLRKGAIAPYLDMANMPTRGHAPNEVVDRPFGSGVRFINGDTLVARITPCLENGKTAFVDFLRDGQVGWGSTEYIVLRPRPPLPEEFAYCLARSDAFREFAIQSMTGTSGRQRVQADALEHFRLPRVPRLVAEAFGRAIKPLFMRSSAAVSESRTLAVLRDALLPKLISGEIRVKDVKHMDGCV